MVGKNKQQQGAKAYSSVLQVSEVISMKHLQWQNTA